ncbi:MAG TPA: pyridoxamine 5'-phosphate oxidase family protein [Chloroflexota bacterium]|nr:pyridoxamine 5'-phosphate oxidase family protein [Chloroflexota bacterium]
MIRALAPEECRQAMTRLPHGRLAVMTDHGPYAVPMLFAVQPSTLAFYTLPGRLLSSLRRHPLGVMVEFDWIESSSHWVSVLATGEFEERSRHELEAPLLALFATSGALFARIAREQVRQPEATFCQIMLGQVSGRAADPEAARRL